MRTVATFSTLGKCWKVSFDLKPVEDWANTATRITSDRFFCEIDLNNYPLKIGEWNRIEITHDEGEDGRFFLSLSVGEKELGQMGLGVMEQEKFTNVEIGFAYSIDNAPPDFPSIRRFLVIEKC